MQRIKKIKDNAQLAKLVSQDQHEREHFFDSPEEVTINDAKRRKKVTGLLSKRKIKTWKDYFNAALIFQHGLTTLDYKIAQKLAQKSVSLENKKWSRWLYALITDRLLVSQGKKQKYGTQFRIVYKHDSKNNQRVRIYKIYPYDRRTSDKTREWYVLPPLKKLLSKDGKTPTKSKKEKPIDLDND